MNECHLYQELLSRLVDGELNKNEYAALEAHMADCAECSAMYAVFASLSDIIGSEDEALPEDLHENIMAGVRRQAMINYNKRRLSKPMRNALAAAACAALVLFAAKGLAPEKASQSVMSAEQAAVMDAQLQPVTEENAVSESAVEAAPVVSTAPAAAAVSAAPVASANPVPTPVPTKDAYLGSIEKNAGTAGSTNNNNKNNYIVVTAQPKEIAVSTPMPTPVPTPVPTVASTPKLTPVATVAPTAVLSESPAAAPASEEAAAAPAAYSAGPDSEPAAAPEMAAAPTAETSDSPAVDAVEETEQPSLSKRFMAFFMPRPAEEETEESAVTETPAEAAASAAPADVSAVPSPAATEEPKKEPKLIKLETLEKLNSLEDMIDGKEAALPEEQALESYVFCLKEPDAQLAEYRLEVHVYAEQIYYVQVLGDKERIECQSTCKLEDFEKFMDSLSDEERAPLLVSPSPSVQPSENPVTEPVSSPAVAEKSLEETEKTSIKSE